MALSLDHDGGEIFCLLRNRYWVIPEGKPAGAWRQSPTPRLATRLKKEYIYTSNPRCAFISCCRVRFTFLY